MKLIPFLLVIFLLFGWAVADIPTKVDINRCTKADLEKLPLTPAEVNALWNRVTFGGPVNSVFDLR